MAKAKNDVSMTTSRVKYGTIINPNRDTSELLDKKLTPTTIKLLLGQLDTNSPEYKELNQKYQEQVLGKPRHGVIHFKGRGVTWDEQKIKSQGISRDYQVSKPNALLQRVGSKVSLSKTKELNMHNSSIKIATKNNKLPIEISKETTNRNKTISLIKPPINVIEHLNSENDSYLEWSTFDINKIKTKLTGSKKHQDNIIAENEIPTKQLIRRSQEEDRIEIKREFRPMIASQILEIKRNGLSIVDFIIDPNEKIKIEKGDEEILVRLIKTNPTIDLFDDFDDQVTIIPKPIPVKVIRTNEEAVSLDVKILTRLENKARFYKLSKDEQKKLDELKSTNSLSTENILSNKFSKKEFKNIVDKNSNLEEDYLQLQEPIWEDRYKKTNYHYQYDTNKRPNIDQKLVTNTKMTEYLMQVREQYEQGYNRQISQELADFNRAINLSRTIKTTDNLLNQKILSNREISIALLRKHVGLLNQKQYAEICLLDKQLLKYQGSKANIEEFIKHQKEFQKLLHIREDVKQNREYLITSLRMQADLMQEARQKSK